MLGPGSRPAESSSNGEDADKIAEEEAGALPVFRIYGLGSEACVSGWRRLCEPLLMLHP